VPSILTETPKRKNEATNIVSIKSENHQIGKQQEVEKENPIIVLKKDSTDKILTKAERRTSKEIPIQKNEATKNVTIKSEVEKIDKPKQVEKVPRVVVLKNNTEKETVSKDAQIAIKKSSTSNIISIKTETKQIVRQEKEDMKIPVIVLNKDSVVSNKTVLINGPHAAAEISKRTIETIKSVTIKSDSLVLTLYDNGEVDGDTVSVLLNGKVIMPMEGLSTKAINKTIYLTPEMGDSIILIMYAENLGSIPPNTGLLVVHDGNDVYYISFSGDLQENAAIILKRKKKN